MKRFALFTAAALCALATAAPPAAAQIRWSAFAVNNNWGTNANWDQGFVPDPIFDLSAIVGSDVLGAAQSASVDVLGTFTAPTVILGDGGVTSGTLNIPVGSSLTTVADLGTGDFRVGANGGLGTLTVGGTLNVAAQFEAFGASASAITLASTANVTARNGFFDRNLTVNRGASVNFTGADASGNGLILGLAGTHGWVIPAAGPATVRVTENADLGGTLNVQFSGVTPTPGQTWNLIDAGSIDAFDGLPSGFGSIITSADGSLGAGQRFGVNDVAGGTNGRLAQLALEQHPVLVVNRQTGAVTVRNPGAVGSIAIDAYVVGSALGGLNAGAFSGGFTEAQGWFNANPTANAISELNPLGSTSLSAGSNLALGNVFAPPTPTEFGQVNEDVTFQYARPGGGFIDGDVLFEGLPNNTLVLNVNPSTGQAQLLNPSGFNVGIDAYVISSESGSLSTAAWNSLDDQNVGAGDWFEANPSSSALSELLVDGAQSLLANNSTVLNIGSPFVSSGARDLEFQFALEGETSLRTGVVVYGALVAPSLPGDANLDGKVDLLDLDILGANFGATGATLAQGDFNDDSRVDLLDLDILGANFGAMAATASAVPEPASLACGVIVALFAASRRRG